MSEENPFVGAERYYAEFRPAYGAATVDYLVERFSLDDESRVLDLGCGAGQLAVPLSRRVGEVVAMDPNEAMLDEARRKADEARQKADGTSFENIEFVRGGDDDLHERMGPFTLTVMGRSFHWMDQRPTLATLRRLAESAGGVALLTDEEWLTKGRRAWQAAVYEVAERFLDDLPARRDPADIIYDDPWGEMLANSGFRDVEEVEIPIRRSWSVDRVVGYVFSLSFCSPARFGDEKGAFERALRGRLEELGGGPFEQEANVEIISGVVDER